jgi:hypothetical protein
LALAGRLARISKLDSESRKKFKASFQTGQLVVRNNQRQKSNEIVNLGDRGARLLQ